MWSLARRGRLEQRRSPSGDPFACAPGSRLVRVRERLLHLLGGLHRDCTKATTFS
jgi:hypothetical protein